MEHERILDHDLLERLIRPAEQHLAHGHHAQEALAGIYNEEVRDKGAFYQSRSRSVASAIVASGWQTARAGSTAGQCNPRDRCRFGPIAAVLRGSGGQDQFTAVSRECAEHLFKDDRGEGGENLVDGRRLSALRAALPLPPGCFLQRLARGAGFPHSAPPCEPACLDGTHIKARGRYRCDCKLARLLPSSIAPGPPGARTCPLLSSCRAIIRSQDSPHWFGPIVIGQGCEFDYSGVQACKALKEEGTKWCW